MNTPDSLCSLAIMRATYLLAALLWVMRGEPIPDAAARPINSSSVTNLTKLVASLRGSLSAQPVEQVKFHGDKVRQEVNSGLNSAGRPSRRGGSARRRRPGQRRRRKPIPDGSLSRRRRRKNPAGSSEHPPGSNENPPSGSESPPGASGNPISSGERLPNGNHRRRPSTPSRDPARGTESPPGAREKPVSSSESPPGAKENPASDNESPPGARGSPFSSSESPPGARENGGHSGSPPDAIDIPPGSRQPLCNGDGCKSQRGGKGGKAGPSSGGKATRPGASTKEPSVRPFKEKDQPSIPYSPKELEAYGALLDGLMDEFTRNGGISSPGKSLPLPPASPLSLPKNFASRAWFSKIPKADQRKVRSSVRLDWQRPNEEHNRDVYAFQIGDKTLASITLDRNKAEQLRKARNFDIMRDALAASFRQAAYIDIGAQDTRESIASNLQNYLGQRARPP